MPRVLVLSAKEVRSLLSLEVVIPVIEEAFAENARGLSTQFPVVREQLAEYNGIFGVKSGLCKTGQLLGLKAGGYWPKNPGSYGVPAHQSTMVMFNPRTGQPVAFLDANPITTVRTAAAGAVAAKHLARPGSATVAVIGGGVQGAAQAEGLTHVFQIREVRVHDINPDAAMKCASYLAGLGMLSRPVHTVEEAVSGVDIIVTTTPSFSPVLPEHLVRDGVHINAMGSDTRGKQEVEETLFRRASLFVDSVEQAANLGETQHALRKAIIRAEDIKAELGQVIAKIVPGRTSETEITVFDATGVAFQDLVAAHLAISRAEQYGKGVFVEI